MGMFMPCVIDCFRAGAIGLYGGTIGVYLGGAVYLYLGVL